MTIKLQSNLYVRPVNTFPNFDTDMIYGLFLSLIPRCTNDTLRMIKYLYSLLYPHSTEDEWGYCRGAKMHIFKCFGLPRQSLPLAHLAHLG